MKHRSAGASDPGRPLTQWADTIESTIRDRSIRCVDRVAILAQTSSTQDACRAMSGTRPGLVLLAGRQLSGRGRLGRQWADTAGLGLAMTMSLPLDAAPAPLLSLVAGIAAIRAIDASLADAQVPHARRIGVRWPNDVVVHDAELHNERKLSGVLIEPTIDHILVGIGINVRQQPREWPEGVRPRAASLAMLGSSWDVLAVACEVIAQFDAALKELPDAIAAAWTGRDVLVGTRRAFTHGRRRVDGEVVGVDPRSFIRVREDSGEIVELPALTTNLIHLP